MLGKYLDLVKTLTKNVSFTFLAPKTVVLGGNGSDMSKIETKVPKSIVLVGKM